MKADKQSTRVRRTSVAIERDVLNAVSEAIRELGFSRLTLKEILERGNVSLPVVNSHFGSMHKLIDVYVSKHDYWLNNTIDIDPLNVVSLREYYINATESLIDSIYKNRELQQLLIWELAEDNATTRRTSKKREAATENLVNYFDKAFENSNIDIKAVTAVIIAGIYHITLRKERSTFCNVDFTKHAGQHRLIEAVKILVNMIFDKFEQDQQSIKAIQNLIRYGVDEEIICKAYDINNDELDRIKKLK